MRTVDVNVPAALEITTLFCSVSDVLELSFDEEFTAAATPTAPRPPKAIHPQPIPWLAADAVPAAAAESLTVRVVESSALHAVEKSLPATSRFGMAVELGKILPVSSKDASRPSVK